MISEERKAEIEEQLAGLPIVQYEFLKPEQIIFSDRVRYVCETECPRYGTTWACPPAVGTVEECHARCMEYTDVFLFTTMCEVPDIGNLEQTLTYRADHEEITRTVRDQFEAAGFETLTLSTESCAICKKCAYPDAPCRHPDKMFPCVESYGILVTNMAEQCGIEFIEGGNVVVWFSLVLLRERPLRSQYARSGGQQGLSAPPAKQQLTIQNS